MNPSLEQLVRELRDELFEPSRAQEGVWTTPEQDAILEDNNRRKKLKWDRETESLIESARQRDYHGTLSASARAASLLAPPQRRFITTQMPCGCPVGTHPPGPCGIVGIGFATPE